MAKVSYGYIDKVHCFKFDGDVRFHDVTGLLDFLNNVNLSNDEFLIDLTHATHLDSTALGCIANIAVIARRKEIARPTIYVVNSQVLEALHGVCFDRIFDIKFRSFENKVLAFKPIIGEVDFDHLKRSVVMAHQTLSEISDQNRKRFQDINELLSRDV
jgi:ABC-type transporter Mla MlaB component